MEKQNKIQKNNARKRHIISCLYTHKHTHDNITSPVFPIFFTYIDVVIEYITIMHTDRILMQPGRLVRIKNKKG